MKTVLHVLPHPGGGGETYVDTLSQMEGYVFSRSFLAPSSRAVDALRSFPRAAFGVQWRARDHDLLHVHGEIASAIVAPSLAVCRSVVTLHGLHLLRRAAGVRRRAAEANLRLIVHAASQTICVAQAELDEVLDIVGPKAGRRLVMIHNGVRSPVVPRREEQAAVRAELRIPSDAVVAVSTGSLDDRKDPLTAALAAAQVAGEDPRLVLLIAGDGPLRSTLEQAMDAARTDAVRILGFRRDIDRILAAADLFVLSSHREGLSYALLEAMARGLPSVVSDAPGNPEAAGDSAIVVGRGDVRGFADALRRLLDGSERRLLGTRARDRAARLFTAEEMVRRTRDVYDEVVGHHRGC